MFNIFSQFTLRKYSSHRISADIVNLWGENIRDHGPILVMFMDLEIKLLLPDLGGLMSSAVLS